MSPSSLLSFSFPISPFQVQIAVFDGVDFLALELAIYNFLAALYFPHDIGISDENSIDTLTRAQTVTIILKTNPFTIKPSLPSHL